MGPTYFLFPEVCLYSNQATRNQLLLSTYNVLDTVMNILNMLCHLIFTTYDDIIAYFINEETESLEN